jgi:DNA anti-recombination protein RmuC
LLRLILTGIIFLSLTLPAFSSGFTEEDRERLIRLEATVKVFMEQSDKRFKELREDINKRFEEMGKRFEQIDKRFEQVDKRFEQVDKRFEQFMNFLWIITGIFTTLTSVVIGFAYWDRRTIIRKAKEETLESLEREGKLKNLIEALKELAKEDEKLARVLKQYGLL